MPYAEGRTYHDADSHVMETPDWLVPYAEPDVRERLKPPDVAPGQGLGLPQQTVADHRTTAAHRGRELDPAPRRFQQADGRTSGGRVVELGERIDDQRHPPAPRHGDRRSARGVTWVWPGVEPPRKSLAREGRDCPLGMDADQPV